MTLQHDSPEKKDGVDIQDRNLKRRRFGAGNRWIICTMTTDGIGCDLSHEIIEKNDK